MGYLLILIKSIANIGESVLIKKYNTKHSAGGMFFTGIISLFALLFFVISDSDGFYFPSAMFPYAISYGIIYCITYLLTFVALACGSFTLSMLIMSYSLVFPIFYGIIFLQEEITALTYVGFVLLAVSIFFVREKKSTEETKISVKWIITVIIATVGNGLLAIIQKVQQLELENTCNNEFMIVALAISSFILLSGGLIKDRKQLKEILRFGVPYAGSAGISNGLNNFLLIYVNNLLPLSIVSPVCAGMKIVVSFLSGKLLFKEKYLKRQIFGVVLGIFALIFLNM